MVQLERFVSRLLKILLKPGLALKKNVLKA